MMPEQLHKCETGSNLTILFNLQSNQWYRVGIIYWLFAIMPILLRFKMDLQVLNLINS